jgi:hypothetical protein
MVSDNGLRAKREEPPPLAGALAAVRAAYGPSLAESEVKQGHIPTSSAGGGDDLNDFVCGPAAVASGPTTLDGELDDVIEPAPLGCLPAGWTRDGDAYRALGKS